MSFTKYLKPLLTVLGGEYDPQRGTVLLQCEREGHTFPLKIDLTRAGAGVSSYHGEDGVLFLSRGAKGKPRGEGETWRDGSSNLIGLFRSSRAVAEWLIALTCKEPQDLSAWPAPPARVLGVTLTDEAITFEMRDYAPLPVPRAATTVYLVRGDPADPMPRIPELSVQVQGGPSYRLDVDTGSEQGRAVLAALGFSGFTARPEGVRAAQPLENAAD